jgi:hypothetical protein
LTAAAWIEVEEFGEHPNPADDWADSSNEYFFIYSF